MTPSKTVSFRKRSMHSGDLSDDSTNDDGTHCAILTGAGRSAVAVVGVRGPAAIAAIEACFSRRSSLEFATGQIRLGDWGSEPVVVTPIDRQTFEIHCHGGPLAADRIVEDLGTFGCVSVDAYDWEGSSDPLCIREARRVVDQCLTAKTAAIAMDQANGALRDWCMELIAELEPLGADTCIDAYRYRIAEIAKSGEWSVRISQPFRRRTRRSAECGKKQLGQCDLGATTVASRPRSREPLETSCTPRR